MLRSSILTVCVLLLATESKAQNRSAFEFGVGIGACSFLGDLGGSSDIGREFIYDLDLRATRPVVSVVFKRNFGKRIAFRINGYFSQIWGDDAYANTGNEPGLPGWHRKYRNLSFKSHILEASLMTEINLLPFEAGSMRNRFTPYIVGGIGLVSFDPKAKYNGSWVRLQPLGTEGQGLPQYPAKQKYSLIATCFPIGGGIKYNLSRSYTLSFEAAHRFTTSDYMDDVSTTYVDPVLFFASKPVGDATLSAALADRSSGLYPEQTTSGQQRGDPSDKDGYTFIGVLTLTYAIKYGTNKFYCPILN